MPDSELEIPVDQNKWLDRAVGPLLKLVKDRTAEVAVEMRKGFYSYSLRTRERCGYLKTIMSRGELISIADFYVSPLIKVGKTVYHPDSFARRLELKKRVVITGTAGLGKSVFMKSLVIEYTQNITKPLPIFLELRDLNDSKQSILDTMFTYVNTPKAFLSREQFEYALNEGMIAFFLDAFDEIDTDIRDNYEREIVNLARKYPDMQVVVSSRPSPSETIEGWGPFENAILQPFDLNRVVELISKLNEDTNDKDKFIELLKARLFQSHKSFLSTPLLALIMFLTYQTGTQIPDKLHEFYHRAFEALYYRHDTSKGHYSRKPYTSLSRDEFRRIISAICAVTYFDNQTSLAEDDFRARVDRAADIEGIKVDTKLLLNDLMEGICMLQKDGVDITFTHRSFQEYFTALFVLNSESLDTFSVINQLIARQTFDNVVAMISEMNREFIEKKWVLRWLELFSERLSETHCIENLPAYLRKMRYSGLIFWHDGCYRFGLVESAENGGAITTIVHTLYSEEYSKTLGNFVFDKERYDSDSKKVVDYYDKKLSLNLERKPKNTEKSFRVTITDADKSLFRDLLVTQNFEQTRIFLLTLKAEIEQRHRAKGEGFMSFIRRPKNTEPIKLK